MILGILLTRRTHLKILSPVIEAALARGHETILVANVRAAKRGDTLDVRELARLYPPARIETTGIYGKLDALIGIDATLPDLKALWLVGVDHFYDAWTYYPRRGANRVMCYHSEWHRNLHAKLWDVEPSGEVVGWLPADQARQIPAKLRDSVVFFALKRDVPEPWRRSFGGYGDYYDLVRQVRQRAHAEGLRFVVKSRAKNRDPLWLRWIANEYVLDDSMVPYTSLRLLNRAEWCVHFESGAVYEAALMGAYSCVLAVPQSHIIDLPGGRLQYGEMATMHDWPGVSGYGVEPKPLEHERREAFLRHFVGACDGFAGLRVVQVAEG